MFEATKIVLMHIYLICFQGIGGFTLHFLMWILPQICEKSPMFGAPLDQMLSTTSTRQRNLSERSHFIFWNWRSKKQALCSKPVSPSQTVSRSQNIVLWHGSVFILCDVRTGWIWVSYCGLLFQRWVQFLNLLFFFSLFIKSFLKR